MIVRIIRSRLVAGLAVVALVALMPHRGQAQAAADSAKRALAAQVLEVTKVAAAIVQGIEAGLPAQRVAMPQIPKEFWDKFLKYARQDVDSLTKLLIPVYAEIYTEQELRDLLAFYRSPLGQRLIATQPTIMARSTQIGQQWGTQLGFRVSMEVNDPAKPPEQQR